MIGLERACRSGDCPTIRSILNEAVDGYQPESEIHDLIWRSTMETAAPEAATRTPHPAEQGQQGRSFTLDDP